MITKPRTIMLDEPLTSLDFPQRMFLLDCLDRHFLNMHSTLLMVTHDVEEAIAIADRIVVIGGRPAKILLDFENSLRTDNPDIVPSKIRQLPGFAEIANRLWATLERQNG